MKIKASTAIYGIFGHPVSHSLSPDMHNRAFEKLGIDSVYVAFDIKPGTVGEAVQALKTLGIRGINITIPHKQSVMEYLDEIDRDARLVGAVNTVNNDGDTLRGYNTDVAGFLRALKEDLGVTPENKKVVLAGAGGAARAVIAALGSNGAAEIVLLNRTLARAQNLVSEFRSHFGDTCLRCFSLEDKDSIKREFSDADILVNSSSAGMKGSEPLDLPLAQLPAGCCVYDLVYEPLITPLIRDSRKAGLNSESGLGMLLFQGVEAFEIWTGRKAPVEEMRRVLADAKKA